MIVTCEKCGKKYQIDPAKLKGKEATATCGCGNKIKISQAEKKQEVLEPVPAAQATPEETPVDLNKRRKKTKEDKKEKSSPPKATKRRVFGLKGKIFTLFFIVPIALIITAGFLFVGQLNGLSSIISDESSKMVTQMAEDIIYDKGVAVAREVKLYLATHPDLKKEDFNKTPEFVEIAMQKVGETGYTLIVERETENHPEYMWVHPNEKLIGIDITDAMKKRLGDKWASWDKIRSKSYITKGYYLWFDNREKYCAGIPIEGTPYNIVSSTYIDEFTQPVKSLQEKVAAITYSTLQIVVLIIGVTALLVAVIAFFYGHRLTSKISKLTDVADRISLGDMDVLIENTGKDELGDLAQAISRMQDSIRLSIERLRRRRDRRAV
jgi:HAMP domain-containing protein